MIERIDNVIILGRGVPEDTSDGRITVCVAGWSESQGFIRLYPSRVDSPLKTWNIVSVEVQRNPKDNRRESWKFPDSRSGWENINQHIEVTGCLGREHRVGLLDMLKSNCVTDINERHDSLGIVKPVIKRYYLSTNKMHLEAHQPLFDFMEHAGVMVKRDHMAEPRFCYLCGDRCKSKHMHDMQLLEWGAYVWMANNPDSMGQVWQNMGIGNEEWTHYFLVGNQNSRRTSYMVISDLRQKTKMFQPALFA